MLRTLFPTITRLGFGLLVVGVISGCKPEARAVPPEPLLPTDKASDAPDFAGISTWLNTKALKVGDLKGKVVIVHFLTNGCINCIHNYPYYRNWSKRYAENPNVVMVGVHTPEFAGEKSLDRLKEQMKKHDLTFAVAVDNDMATWKAWKNQYWPAVYLIDAQGKVRKKHEGELGEDSYNTMTTAIDALLKDAAK